MRPGELALLPLVEVVVGAIVEDSTKDAVEVEVEVEVALSVLARDRGV